MMIPHFADWQTQSHVLARFTQGFSRNVWTFPALLMKASSLDLVPFSLASWVAVLYFVPDEA